MDTVTSITPLALYASLGTPQAPWMLDVRRDPAYDADSQVIVSALRVDDPVAFAAKDATARSYVVYCVHGQEVSQESARALRKAGRDAIYLEGGIEAWREAGLPTIRRHPEWRVPGGSRWITRERPKIDRVACPWLIRRFIDPLASFDYVPTKMVFDEAKARGGVPYDILAPQCAGLVATSLGLSRRFTDDHEMLEAAMPVYDGLYAWCRAEHEGDHERHNWKPPA